ncbi:ABC transporter ATP-binding protein [Pimelobacter simplex]|uniref:ABC transporter ATP-binding protein n=1 Tax=Nocardioides simplex TaxID=2045 RepID=UPI00214FF0B1|nr:ABC transporter ATP-binding protein [Pimelobacter simplex]UUW89858.1 ABC transporter ATP-binding protein [Pimelobacter simplex]UUW93687.1 ABC transporter ATP-binding protein [Pimelobacter simplex]
MSRLRTEGLRLGYGERTVVEHLDLTVPDGVFTAIVGPNACGKSTLLRSLVRLLKPEAGSVVLDGRTIATWRPKAVARELGFLPQGTTTPDGIRVVGLVRRGRYARQPAIGTWTRADDAAVAAALDAAGVADLADRRVSALSGGQRQRVWIAMVLAQETPYLLLDEPTTFLDIAHQYELLRILRRLVDDGRTVVAVLHDLNQACRFADHVVAMRDGAVVATGAPAEVVDAALVERVFGLACAVLPDPITGTPMVVPHA